ncbi:MAG: PilX N-terminal domain-containing pilus assembly protein [Pseudomonadales bacterium]|nr:PilX N-terminal domain-containing pilus assembly protein [Pseudomonadales bacterium]
MKKLNNRAGLPRIQQQQGAILVFCLIFLTVLTMMGVSGMESTTLEERMSANMVDKERAFNAADTALQAAEAWLILQDTLPITSTDGSTTVWGEDDPDLGLDTADGMYWWEHANVTAAWWTANGDAPANVPVVATQPRYLIEEYKTVDTGQSIAVGGGETTVPRIFHRITAAGWGIANTTSAVVQATFVQTYD